mmetsp:Transcript_8616/g.7637  ORF Transcript_8616/g.7637 Transcript_8616/m.7637 type:complete len:238 (+) Transcript_8616:166-879(+)
MIADGLDQEEPIIIDGAEELFKKIHAKWEKYSKYYLQELTIKNSQEEDSQESGISKELLEILINGFVYAKMTKLSFENVDLTDKDAPEEASSQMKTLRDKIYETKIKAKKNLTLKFYRCKLGDRLDFIDFDDSHEEISIDTLILQEVGLNDENLDQLINLSSKLRRTKMLSLHHNQITAKGVKLLVDREEEFAKGVSVFLYSNKTAVGGVMNKTELNEYIQEKKEELERDLHIRISI